MTTPRGAVAKRIAVAVEAGAIVVLAATAGAIAVVAATVAVRKPRVHGVAKAKAAGEEARAAGQRARALARV